MNELCVSAWPIDKVIPFARDARKIPASAVDKLAASIKEFGWRQPIVVDREAVIICVRRPMLNHTHHGDVVYDPFLGSGTTLMAAELNHRICYGIEIDPKYVDVIVLRWQAVAGQPATLEADGCSYEVAARERGSGST